ncbi:MAG TPA: SMP-30/gluconolactonase/LRE family protein [Thermoguttaceae bacterium]|nr:SMP-30/gluconolactonase/LRE family protein [Thermoguttaceae bacterium]
MTFDDIIAPGTKPDVLGTGYGFCEGPAADGRGNIYFSDGKHDSIHYYEVGKPVTRLVDDSTDANGMMFNARGELCVCEGAAHRIVAIDVQTRERRVLVDQIDGTPFNEPNDLAVDRTGGFYFSDPNYQHHGQPTVMKQDAYYCSADGEVARVSTVCFKPNGVLLSADERTLYLADSRGQRIYRYKVLGPGHLADETLWIDALGANPDGLTLDEHNNLYICLGKAGMKVFSPDAKLLGKIEVPCASNTCFGGPEFQTLFITSSDKFLGIETQVVGLKPLCL